MSIGIHIHGFLNHAVRTIQKLFSCYNTRIVDQYVNMTMGSFHLLCSLL